MDEAKPRHRKPERRQRNLTVLLKSLMGKVILVEMKNEVEVEGLLEFVDEGMNLTMTAVRSRNPFTNQVVDLEVAFIPGTKILYVHVPDSINMIDQLRRYTRMLETNRGRLGKQKRKAPSR